MKFDVCKEIVQEAEKFVSAFIHQKKNISIVKNELLPPEYIRLSRAISHRNNSRSFYGHTKRLLSYLAIVYVQIDGLFALIYFAKESQVLTASWQGYCYPSTYLQVYF